VVAVVAAVVCAVMVGTGVLWSSADEDPRETAGSPSNEDETTSSDGASDPTGTTDATDTSASATGSTRSDSGGTAAVPTVPAAPPTTAPGVLPGVVDVGDPAAVTRAVLDLAAAGVAPTDAAPHLAGGDERIVTELFMFAAEGLSVVAVDGCRAGGATESSAGCSATVETSYGARAAVDLTLIRARNHGAWYISRVQLRRE
jgi:hypothetical protein